MANDMTTTSFRAWIYEYLAQLFDGTVDGLPEPPDAAGTAPRIAAAADALRAAIAASPAEDAQTDHARLFVNTRQGVAAPPYASWYLDRQLVGPSARWVERAYADQGLERAPDAGEPPDYVGAELEFLHFLARHELAARSTGDEQSLRLVLDSEKTFVLDHVSQWLPAFTTHIRNAEPGPVFAAACTLLSAVVREDVIRLSTDRCKTTASLGHG